MAYTLPDADDVIALTGTQLTSVVVGLIITSAEQMVLTCLEGMTDDKATAVLLWLSAHLVASAAPSNGSLTGRSLGDSNKSWAKASMGDGLKGTTYGQQVLMLDESGCIGRLGRGVATLEII